MKKILILANSSGGLYDFRNELLEKLLKEYEVVVSLPDEVRNKELAQEGCKVVHTPINRRGVNPAEDFKLIRDYAKLMKREKPDLVLTYTIKPNIYGGLCCRIKKIPYIVTVTGLGSTFQKQGFFLKMIVSMYRMGLKKASCVFFQNKENQQIFAKYGIRGRASRLVQGSGVNLQRHAFEDYPKEDTVRFLFVGRMMREKGIEEFLMRQRHCMALKFCLRCWGIAMRIIRVSWMHMKKRAVLHSLALTPMCMGIYGGRRRWCFPPITKG